MAKINKSSGSALRPFRDVSYYWDPVKAKVIFQQLAVHMLRTFVFKLFILFKVKNAVFYFYPPLTAFLRGSFLQVHGISSGLIAHLATLFHISRLTKYPN